MAVGELTINRSRIMIDGMEYVSVEEGAALTGYRVSYLRILVREGKIKGEKKGTMWWVQLDSLNEYKRQMDLLGSEKFSPWRDRED